MVVTSGVRSRASPDTLRQCLKPFHMADTFKANDMGANIHYVKGAERLKCKDRQSFLMPSSGRAPRDAIVHVPKQMFRATNPAEPA